jgi:hypothetical protein
MNLRSFLLLIALLASAVAAPASSATFTVTNTTDADVGSLRWAISESRATAGPHRIVFDVPGDVVHLIQLQSALPTLTNPVAIDATTQPGYVSFPGIAGTPRIELSGALLGGSPIGITLNPSADGSSIRGMSVGNFDRGIVLAAAQPCTLAANPIGCDASGTVERQNQFGIHIIAGANHLVGGSNAKARNVISGNYTTGIFGDGTSDLRIQGNYIDTNATGTAALPNGADGIGLQDCFRTTIGGTNPGEGHLISGNGVDGISVLHFTPVEPGNGHSIFGTRIGTNVYGTGAIPNQEQGADVLASYSTVGHPQAPNVVSGNSRYGVRAEGSFVVIQDNFIGTTFDGTGVLGNGQHGIILFGTSNQILRNVIGGNLGHGIWLASSESSDNIIRANAIGTNVGGATILSNGIAGIRNELNSNNFIGGPSAGDGNIIAYNQRGVHIAEGAGISLRRNRIYSNVALNIDLNGAGVTSNDDGDVDTGANNLQNYPELSSVAYENGLLTIQGTLMTEPFKQVVVDIFSSPLCHTSGFGGGETWVTSVPGVTNDSGLMSIFYQGPGVEGIAGYQFAATATVLELDGVHASTSEFSPCEELAGPVVTVEPSSERAFAFAAPHPQPARGALRMPFALSRTSRVTLRAWGVAGRLAATLLDEARDAGLHEITWDARSLGPGVYRLGLTASATDGSAERFTASRKVVVVR